MEINLKTPVMCISNPMTVVYRETVDGKIFKYIQVDNIPLMEINLKTQIVVVYACINNLVKVLKPKYFYL